MGSHLINSQITCCDLPHSRLLSTSQPVAVRGRNRIVAGASNPQDLSQEARALIEQAHDPDDLSWQPGYGIGQPITLDVSTEERTRALQYEVPYKGYAANVDNGGEVVKYWPHRGEELPNDPPSPVLMVTKVKTVSKEQHWVQHACEQIGLGSRRQLRTKAGKVAALFIFFQEHNMLAFRSEVGCSCPTCLQCVPSSTRSSMWLTSPQSPFQMACLTISTRIPMASNLRLRENLLWRAPRLKV